MFPATYNLQSIDRCGQLFLCWQYYGDLFSSLVFTLILNVLHVLLVLFIQKVSHFIKCNLFNLKILLVHFNSSIALNAYLLTENQWESRSLAGIACFGWLRNKNRKWPVHTSQIYFVIFPSLAWFASLFLLPMKYLCLGIVLLTPLHTIVFLFSLLIFCWWVRIFYYTIFWLCNFFLTLSIHHREHKVFYFNKEILLTYQEKKNYTIVWSRSQRLTLVKTIKRKTM